MRTQILIYRLVGVDREHSPKTLTGLPGFETETIIEEYNFFSFLYCSRLAEDLRDITKIANERPEQN